MFLHCAYFCARSTFARSVFFVFLVGLEFVDLVFLVGVVNVVHVINFPIFVGMYKKSIGVQVFLYCVHRQQFGVDVCGILRSTDSSYV